MKKLITCLLVFILPVLPAYAGEKEDIDQAIVATQSWIQSVDAGKYADSWNAAALTFQQAVTVEKWQQALVQVRSPLGSMKSREVMKATGAPKYQSTPDGDFVMIQFSTQFENFPQAIETVSPMRQKDGSWRVAGYFVKPRPAVGIKPATPEN